MTDSADLASGKGHKDENFPVASALIAARHRPAVMAFYAVARMADDIADHATAPPEEKLARLAAVERSLDGVDDLVPQAAHLRRVLAERRLSDQHMRDLLEAFRRDVTKSRYADWDELLDYCRYSACPVGRFMLDVHGESRAAWPANDALCSALQIINHLQDCARDYRELNRVYLPGDALSAAGVTVETLGEARASAALLGVIGDLAARTGELLARSDGFAGAVSDLGLSLEIGVIHRLGAANVERLRTRDPLSERVHPRPIEAVGGVLIAVAATLAARLGGSAKPQRGAIGP